MLRILSSLILVGWSAFAFGQILDDSSELVYGPSTLNVVYLDDLKNNRTELHWIDTTITKIEMFSFVDRNNRYYQDLGNIGTAMFPVFYDLPSIVGARAGFHAYDPMTPTPSTIQYYDTKSPYIKMSLLFGGKGRTMANVHYTQNINANWNIGFTVSRTVSDKQIGATSNEGDRNVSNTIVDFFSYYQHPEVPYKMMFNVISFDQKVNETGGILIADSARESEKFQYQDNSIQLKDALATDRRINLHLYHEYGLFKQFQMYHQLDQERQTNSYQDFDVNDDVTYRDYYDRFLIDRDSTYERSEFRSFSNEVGLKGTISAIFYRFYIRNRIVNHEFLYEGSGPTVVENYIGGLTQFRWRDLFSVNGEVELLQSGEFRFMGAIDSKLLNLSYTSMRYKPSNLAQRYFGNHYEWNQSLDPIFTNELQGSVDLRWDWFKIKPFASLKTITNWVYYGLDQFPQQSDASTLVTRIGGDFDVKIRTSREKKSGFHFENEAYFTTTSGQSAETIQIPALFYNGRFYWSGNTFKETVPLQVGFGIHGKSSYFANAYNPMLQQFYLQQDDKLPQFVAIDFFLNMQVEKIFLFLKVTHANQPGDGGYFVTPDYPGQQRSIDLGIKWMFFD